MMDKKCFTIIHCTLHDRCERAHADWRAGYFSPQTVGEHCPHFLPRVQAGEFTLPQIVERRND
jgi:hypothetical protein